MTNSIDAVVAEGVAATIATYAHALDDGRTDDIVALFCADGTAEILGAGAFEGHDAIRALYTGLVPTQPQRHLVANTVITTVSADEATAISDFVFVQRGEAGWIVPVTGQYEDTLRKQDGKWLFHHRRTTFVP
ncbi:nuclear transport factor 2 family protein [Nocardia sp. XZ_19_231]|uniref:nuclear transport factor 2 family protein n=1 Tax=Nocardia sp. XZ_19_231 TaxID=2769252 RepID=UPI00188FCAFA|nr:nuclear transport factor 2 family protein [Nocardia sp. XZ_19_231]